MRRILVELSGKFYEYKMAFANIEDGFFEKFWHECLWLWFPKRKL